VDVAAVAAATVVVAPVAPVAADEDEEDEDDDEREPSEVDAQRIADAMVMAEEEGLGAVIAKFGLPELVKLAMANKNKLPMLLQGLAERAKARNGAAAVAP
jgi:hypothetical protein